MYPSVIASLTDPLATDRLNNPSHSALHRAENAEIEAIETFVGTISSTQGSLVYDIRSSDSDGGGHVQSANKGGTGQTSYAKGDVLVGRSSSVLSKLSVGSVAGYALVVDPGQPLGIGWSPTISNKVFVNFSSVSVARGAASAYTVLFAASVAGSTLGSSNVIRMTGEIRKIEKDQNAQNLLVQALYGGSVFSGFSIPMESGSIVGAWAPSGNVEVIMAANSTSSQMGYVKLSAFSQNGSRFAQAPGGAAGITGYGSAMSLVDSNVPRDLVVQMRYDTADTRNSILSGITIVEKIA